VHHALGTAITTLTLAGAAMAQDAGEIMKRVASHYASIDAVKITAKQQTVMQGMEDTAEFIVLAQRPNRVSIKMDQMGEYAFVCDGEHLFHCFSMGGSDGMYSETDAPKDFRGLMSEAMMGQPVELMMALTSGHVLVLDLLSLPDGSMFSGLASEYVGAEEMGGVQSDRIRLSSPQVAVDLWIESGDAPWVVRARPNLSKMFEDLEGIQGFEPPEMEVQHDFSWDTGAKLDGAFAYSPPEGARKVDSLMEALMAEAGGGAAGMEPASELIGAEAPAVELDMLGGEPMSLGAHRGKDIVVLDFWATWCPPCVAGLPKVSGVTERFKDKGVVFYAVNVQETERTINAFLEKQELDIPVALDRDGSVSAAYAANAIPQTVIIDKEGKVQAVHVGLLPNLEEQLADELQTLLDGKDLFDPERLGWVDEGAVEDEMRFESVWAKGGGYSGVGSAGGRLYVAGRGGLTVLDADGGGQAELPVRASGQEVLPAQLDEDEGVELVTFQTWGQPARAWDDDGSSLWVYDALTGVDDVAVGDIDGDGIDEVAVGYNGGGGLHLVGADGERRWVYGGIGNVWHVAIGPVDGEGTLGVITTSATGQVHLFSAEGKKLRDMRPGGYANFVRIGRGEEGPMIVASASGGAESLVGMTLDGSQRWRTPLARGDAHISAGRVSPGGSRVAVVVDRGEVVVVETATGRRLASSSVGGMADVAWVRSGDEELLAVTNGAKVQVLRIVEKEED